MNTFYVTADKGDRMIDLLITTHKTSRCGISAFDARALALILLQVDPWKLEVELVDAMVGLPRDIYETRWIGRSETGYGVDALRFEYRKVGARTWERRQ